MDKKINDIIMCKDCIYWTRCNIQYREKPKNEEGECLNQLWQDAEGWSKCTYDNEYCSRAVKK